jgi:hypothetical protein
MHIYNVTINHTQLQTNSRPTIYMPELDDIPELDHGLANFFQSQIGILRWCVELGCSAIITEVSMMSTYRCESGEVHLDDVLHVFPNLAQHHNTRVMFDPTYPEVYMHAFVKTDLKSMYGDVKEFLPSEAPTLHGK